MTVLERLERCRKLGHRWSHSEVAKLCQDATDEIIELRDAREALMRDADDTESQVIDLSTISYAVDEWLHGRISDQQLRESAQSIFAQWEVDE